MWMTISQLILCYFLDYPTFKLISPSYKLLTSFMWYLCTLCSQDVRQRWFQPKTYGAQMKQYPTVLKWREIQASGLSHWDSSRTNLWIHLKYTNECTWDSVFSMKASNKTLPYHITNSPIHTTILTSTTISHSKNTCLKYHTMNHVAW